MKPISRASSCGTGGEDIRRIGGQKEIPIEVTVIATTTGISPKRWKRENSGWIFFTG